MTKEQFIKELEHIAESGSNEIRLGNLFDLIISQDRESRWISVKERLPDNYSDVLVINVCRFIHVVHFNDPNFLYKPNRLPTTSVPAKGHMAITHWQPLPEPPKL